MTHVSAGDVSLTPYQKAGFNELSLFRVVDTHHSCEGQIVWLSKDDGDNCPRFSSHAQDIQHHFLSELEELPKDADGFYLWDGGECPVQGDWLVHIKTRTHPDGKLNHTDKIISEAAMWAWDSKVDPITAFKPISHPNMPRHSEAVAQAESTVALVDQGDISEDIISEILIPRELWEHRRKEMLKESIDTHLRKEYSIPIEWVEEFNELINKG